jgi:sugar phosphate isomerase/epimerase
MYKNLAPKALGIKCRQSELIELSLTHKFGGFDLDLQNFQEQVEAKGLDNAARFLKSAKVKLNGGELPIHLSVVDKRFESEMALAKPLLETAQALEVETIGATIEACSNERPYHENFEFHRQRMQRFAEIIKPYGLRVALSFLAPAKHRELYPQPFISKPDELITLLKLIGDESVGMVADLWHWTVAESSYELLSTVEASQIFEVRLADIPTGVEPATATDEQREMPRIGEEAEAPIVPCVETLRRLSELGYTGPVSIVPFAKETISHRREQAVLAAVECYEKLLAAAGMDSEGNPLPAVDDEEEQVAESAEA